MNNSNSNAYGRGWSFPPKFTLDGGVKMADGVVDVEEALKILFLTQQGERLMHQDFGSGLRDLVFANIDGNLEASIVSEITDRIRRYEPRVDVVNVDVSLSEGSAHMIIITVHYALAYSGRTNVISMAFDTHSGHMGAVT